MGDTYILDSAGNLVREPDLIKWSRWMGSDARNLTQKVDRVGESEISTIFIGRSPLFYETMVFDGPLDGQCERYATSEQATTGHANMCEQVRSKEIAAQAS